MACSDRDSQTYRPKTEETARKPPRNELRAVECIITNVYNHSIRPSAMGFVAWVETHRKILELTTGWSIGNKDVSDDRLARVIEELGKQSLARQEIEIKLGRQIIRAYELPTKIARTDTTSFSVNHENTSHLEDNLLRHGYSKDKRPDLLQYRQLLATLDPMGMPLVSATLEGNGADDPLYFPTWQKIQKVIGHKHFVFIADCKAGSISTRANIALNGGFYCVPLPMSGQNPQLLKQWVKQRIPSILRGRKLFWHPRTTK